MPCVAFLKRYPNIAISQTHNFLSASKIQVQWWVLVFIMKLIMQSSAKCKRTEMNQQQYKQNVCKNQVLQTQQETHYSQRHAGYKFCWSHHRKWFWPKETFSLQIGTDQPRRMLACWQPPHPSILRDCLLFDSLSAAPDKHIPNASFQENHVQDSPSRVIHIPAIKCFPPLWPSD